ncbi:hypothetical protein [Hymenobacter rubripertinctus]|uniref:Uncharacterized protein n=1 Tax=Hymenobacter rubripertinctus TaxID=2029981 RepID=A0A418QTU1_9BACT|nr:hypothetical protein [Hymenobacter rubripertinctus]RIY08612.1 hypothetical protein D0T11_13935 [Hymenobacter rubripertinctus]
MTRASLLHLLDHVTGISEAEIRELEQLAAAFPYCQTAHVLLAKAAHDRGSMLAGQRLRRAATYAADRELLRQLLEQPATPPTATPTAAAEAVAPTASSSEAVAPGTDLFAVAAPQLSGALLPDSSADMPTADAAAGNDEVTAEPAGEEEPTVELVQPENADVTVGPSEPDAAALPEFSEQTSEGASLPPPQALAAEEAAPQEAPAPAAPETQQLATAELPATTADAETGVAAAAATELNASVTAVSEPAAALAPTLDLTASDAEPQPAPVVDDEPANQKHEADDRLPAAAPPIRPPVEAGISRFEFGLGESRLPEPSGYRLPEAEHEADDAEAADRPTPDSVPPPAVTAPFRADADLGYALGAGSRLGYDLQPHDGFTLDLPLDSFFEPDALLLAYARAHQPKPHTSSLDLINRFLRVKPRIKTPGGVPLPASEQADLSVRSTRAAPALASESLAKIMIRQGKPEKALEIYERLMARQPEKKAYFAEQIQQLQQPPE